MTRILVVLSSVILLFALVFIIGIGSAAQVDNTTTEYVGEVSDDIAAYNGSIGADSPMYGLKIALEDLDESFTFDNSQRLQKGIDHAELRIAEVKKEFAMKRTDSAERVLELYLQKLNLTNSTLSASSSNAIGLLHAQEMIIKHQFVLENLLLSNPNNTGLMRAYNNSIALEQRFEDKTEIKLDRIMEKNHRVILKAVRVEIKEQNRQNKDNNEQTGQGEQQGKGYKEKTKEQKTATPVPTTITTQPTQSEVIPSVTVAPQQDHTPSKDEGKKGGKGDRDN